MTLRQFIEAVVALAKTLWALIVLLLESALELILDTPLATSVPLAAVALGGLILYTSWVSKKDLDDMDDEEARIARESREFGITFGSIFMIVGVVIWYACR